MARKPRQRAIPAAKTHPFGKPLRPAARQANEAWPRGKRIFETAFRRRAVMIIGVVEKWERGGASLLRFIRIKRSSDD